MHAVGIPAEDEPAPPVYLAAHAPYALTGSPKQLYET